MPTFELEPDPVTPADIDDSTWTAAPPPQPANIATQIREAMEEVRKCSKQFDFRLHRRAS